MSSVLAACAKNWGRPSALPEGRPRTAWPEPPERPRIELVSMFSTAADLGITGSFWKRVANLVTGGGDVRMVRPTGVAVAGAHIAVADPGAGLVHVYDTEQRRTLTLTACGDATLEEPVAVAWRGEELYVADSLRARIDVFATDGDCDRGWQLESGSRPAGLAVDRQRDRLYVADVGAHQVLGFDAHGDVVLRIGRRGVGPGAFNYPSWVAVASSGDVYVTDALNFRVQIFDANGAPRAAFGNQGDSSGDLARPKGIAVDRDGHIYLVDALFDAVQMFDREGHYLMVFGGQGRDPGHLWLPSGVAIDGDRIYVADSYNRRVQVFRFLGGEP